MSILMQSVYLVKSWINQVPVIGSDLSGTAGRKSGKVSDQFSGSTGQFDALSLNLNASWRV